MACRMIHESVFTSEDLIDLPPMARLLWIGLIVHADNRGLVRQSSGFSRYRVLPGLRCSRALIKHWFDTFTARKMLSSCTHEGVSYWQLTNWRKYQRLRSYTNGREDEEKMKRREDEESTRAREVPEVTVVRKDRTSAVNRLNSAPFCFAPPKALDIVDRLGTTPEDLDEWLKWEKSHGTVSMMAKIQHYRNPGQVPAEITRTSRAKDPEPNTWVKAKPMEPLGGHDFKEVIQNLRNGKATANSEPRKAPGGAKVEV